MGGNIGPGMFAGGGLTLGWTDPTDGTTRQGGMGGVPEEFHRRVIFGLPVLIVLLLSGRYFWSRHVPAAIILAISLVYGFLPTIAHFLAIVKRPKAIDD